MKNALRLENYYNPEGLKQEINSFVHYYNNHRYHEFLNKTTPSDVYFSRDKQLLKRRRETRNNTMKKSRESSIENKQSFR